MNKEEVLDKLKSEEAVVVREGIFALSSFPHLEDDIVALVIEHLGNENKGIQSAASGILRKYPHENVIEKLLPVISNMDLSLRNTAMSILESIGVACIPILEDALKRSADVDETIQFLVVIGGIGSKKGTGIVLEYCKKEPDLPEAAKKNAEDPNVKSTAIEALGKIGDADAVDTLLALFEQEEDIRYTIVEALGRIGDERGFELLSNSMKSEDVLLYFSTIQALGHYRSEKCLPLLVEEMKTADASTKKIVLKSLFEIEAVIPGAIHQYGDDDAFVDAILELEDDLNKEEEIYFATIEAALHNAKVQESLLSLLESELSALREIAKKGLKLYGDSIKTQLISRLESPNPATVIDTLSLIGDMKDSSVVSSLKLLVNNKNSSIRRELARVLGNLGGDEAKEILKYFAKDSNETVRMTVAETMGKLEDKDLISMLIPLFTDPNGHVRRLSINAAGKLGAEELQDELVKIVKTEAYGDVREAAVAVLAKLKDSGTTTELIKLLDSENDRVRDSVAKEIHHTGSEFVANSLVRHLKDSEWRVVLSALGSLGKLAQSDSLRDITNAYKTDDWQVRISAIEALSHFKSDKAKSTFLKAVEDFNSFVAQKAICCLGDYHGDEIRRALCESLSSEHFSVRYQAAKGLAKYGDLNVEESQKALMAQLKSEDNDGIITRIIETLSALNGSMAIPDELIGKFFDNTDPNVRAAMINYLMVVERLEALSEVAVLLFEGDPWLKNYFTEIYHVNRNPILKTILEKSSSNYQKRLLDQQQSAESDIEETKEFLILSKLVSEKTGLKVENRNFLFNRLRRELGKHYFTSFADYYFFLKYAPEQETRKAYDALFDSITNPSTSFFGEMEQIKVLVDTVIPDLIEEKQKEGSGDKKIKILSAGCSFGPEVYSLAMAITEKRFDSVTFEIEGVDISHICLNTAKRGIYKSEMLRTVERKYEEDYTEDDRGDRRITDAVKNLVDFRFMNLNDPVIASELGGYDIVICRNLFGDLTSDARQFLAEALYSGLNTNGVMFISSHESLYDATKAFRLVNHGNTVIYKKA